jgi:hypothetical protein
MKNQEKMIFHSVEVPIFSRSVFFVGNCDDKEASDAIYQFDDKRTRIYFSATSLGGVRDAEGDVYVWVRDLSKASIVAHELGHAACSIMECCGINLCRETEELMCYLIEWLKISVQDPVYQEYEKLIAKEGSFCPDVQGLK